VEFPEAGLSFTIPEGWLGGVPAGSAAFVMGSETQPGVIIALTHQGSTTDEVLAELDQPVALDEGVTMQVQGQPQVDDPWVKAQIIASDGAQMLPGYLMALVREDGPGALFIAFGQASANFYRKLVAGLAGSLKLTPPQAPVEPSQLDTSKLVEDSPLAQQWRGRLAGKKVSFRESYSSGGMSGGYALSRDYYLCSDGRFAYRDTSSMAVYVEGYSASSASPEYAEGRWRVVTQEGQAMLELRWGDGRITYRALDHAEGRTYLDGERWFVTEENDLCG